MNSSSPGTAQAALAAMAVLPVLFCWQEVAMASSEGRRWVQLLPAMMMGPTRPPALSAGAVQACARRRRNGTTWTRVWPTALVTTGNLMVPRVVVERDLIPVQ